MAQTEREDHRPVTEAAEDLHVQQNQQGLLPKRVLPRTEVPAYLAETPMQEQGRHAQSFHTHQPAAMQGGSRPGFERPGLEENLDLIQANLDRFDYFDIRHRQDDSAEAEVAAGDRNTDGDDYL